MAALENPCHDSVSNGAAYALYNVSLKTVIPHQAIPHAYIFITTGTITGMIEARATADKDNPEDCN
jgi:hypothetical protein